MFKHIVCFKFFDRAQAPIVKAKLESLVGKVEQLRSMECEVDELATSRSYDLVLIVAFDTIEAYKEYDIHPEHQIVRKYIQTVRESSVAIDYTFSGGRCGLV